MSMQSMPAKRVLKAGLIMSALWLGAATILALQAHGTEKVTPAVSGHTFSYLNIMSNAHLDNLPIE
jgi:hypothetical protein